MNFTQTYSGTIVDGEAGFTVPLIVAVTGHRDLVDAELSELCTRVETEAQ